MDSVIRTDKLIPIIISAKNTQKPLIQKNNSYTFWDKTLLTIVEDVTKKFISKEPQRQPHYKNHNKQPPQTQNPL